jgi:hypothetical protein
MSEDQAASTGEFEREPVPKSALLGFKSFLGMYAGEHCAGTELMIGPLFVAAGVSAYDLVVGLLLGNLLAILSWVLFTAPIATRARLTLYFQLEKICGRHLVTLYNLANGVMFCFLAGSMITVSATAVGVWFKFPMPGLEDVYPNSAGWVIAVLVVGAVISVIAAFGYKTVSKFANIAAPWMALVFLVFGIVALKDFITATGAEIHSLKDLWQLAETTIWKGGDPLPGQTKFTFWHVTFFAWFCNMAMHIGMADLSVLRFAKKSWYGVASAAGMYVGPLHGLDCRITPVCVSTAPRSHQHRRVARPFGLSGLRCGRFDLCNHRRMDYRKSNHLPSRPGVSGDHAESITVCGHAGDRCDRDDRRHVPRHRYETVGIRCHLWHDSDADGSDYFRRSLSVQTDRPDSVLCRAEW